MKVKRSVLFTLLSITMLISCLINAHAQKIIKGGGIFTKAAFKPAKIIVKDGFIYILDKGDMKIKIFDNKGKKISEIGKKGQGPGEFTCLADFSLDSGKIYALDSCGGN